MKREDAEGLYQAYERALAVLAESESVLWQLPKGPEREALVRAYSHVTTSILCDLRAPLVREYPDLDTEGPQGPHDTEMDQDEQDAVDRLSPSEVQEIDAALLAECTASWRKVARVVGEVMLHHSERFPEIVDGYFATRVAFLVSEELLDSQGNLGYMRFSEVRLPQAESRDA